MKPSAIVGIVIGLIAVIVGVILCSSADSAAKNDGFNLHKGFFDENGNIVNSYSFAKGENTKDTSKIDVSFDNAEVIIYGGAAKSEIVVENLLPGQFLYFIDGGVLTVSNRVSLSGLFDAAGMLEFDGIRNYLDSELLKTRKTKVYVKIDESSEIIQQLSIDVKNCDVTVRDVVGKVDIRIMSENSDIKVKNCTTTSKVNIEGINTRFDIDSFEFNTSDVKLSGGSSFRFDSAAIVLYRFNIQSDRAFTINGITFEEKFERDVDLPDYPLIQITSEGSDINLSVSQSVE